MNKKSDHGNYSMIKVTCNNCFLATLGQWKQIDSQLIANTDTDFLRSDEHVSQQFIF